ncbi:peptidase M20 [Pseudonocardia acaciae]|uniref:peptidase M20 n=1 Tax=Pseudonocardia acaciae TaxID=551276 RepID=UPI0005625B45|nr:peptidase M20 [Pseudonocardia acaciae]
MDDHAKRHAWDWIENHRPDLSGWHTTIWEFAEPAWREYRSAAWYVDRLRGAGFDVEVGSGGMPTAFAASWSNGPGPTVLTYAEYDAVPGNCQAAATSPGPRPGLSRFAPGHTDPHSALGISTLGGLLAAQHAMREHGIGGTLRYTGEPAEKVQGSKVVHGLRGYYDVDAIVSYHPYYSLPMCNTARWDTHCGAYYSKIFTFRSDHPETWADAGTPIPSVHSSARAPGANAALFAMYSLTKSTQDAMAPTVGGWSLSEAILTAGNATADHLPAGLAQIQYSWRAPTLDIAERILAVLDANAEAAARTAHCDLHARWVARNRPGLANHAMAALTYRNLAAVGPPGYDEAAVAVGRDMQRALGVPVTDKPFLPDAERLVEPREAERRLRELLPPWQANSTSDDYVEMTWYAPTARFYVAGPELAPTGTSCPAWVYNALGGIPATIDPSIVCAAKTTAGALLDLLRDRPALHAAQEEFERRRAGGPKPLLPPEFTAPVDYPWPEYVTTERGRDWSVPLNAEV